MVGNGVMEQLLRAAIVEDGPQDRRGILELFDRALQRQAGHLTRVAVKTRNTIHVVHLDDVDWIEAARNYACLHARGRTHHYRATLNRLQVQLDPERFVRIHRSTIVNIDRVATLEPRFHGEYTLTLRDGTRLILTAPYRHGVEQLLGHF
jgi:two-component system LytT family response regulator